MILLIVAIVINATGFALLAHSFGALPHQALALWISLMALEFFAYMFAGTIVLNFIQALQGTGAFTGPKGDTGPRGFPGEKGKDGRDGYGYMHVGDNQGFAVILPNPFVSDVDAKEFIKRIGEIRDENSRSKSK